MSTLRVLLAASLVLAATQAPAGAALSSDQPAALLLFPLISVDATTGTDSVVQLTNAGDPELAVRCVYENRVAGSSATPFSIQLVRNQPIGWRASAGLATVPGGGGSIPALGSGPFTGVLRCVTVNAGGMPSNINALVGSATIERATAGATAAVDSAHYNASGLDSRAAAADGDEQLILGGPAAEYAPCPEELVLQAFFDGAVLPLGAAGAVEHELSTTIAVLTCAHAATGTTAATLSFRVINEMGQITSTSRSVIEQLVAPLSLIDTSNPSQSIFNAAVQGTLTGLIRITALNSGALAVALQQHTDADDERRVHRVAVRPQLVGERTEPDVIDLAVSNVPTATTTPVATPTASAGPTCAGDCDGDGEVEINELILGVNIALANRTLDACPAFDADGGGTVSIGELISAVGNSLNGCQ
jgi:hypothetical protein